MYLENLVKGRTGIIIGPRDLPKWDHQKPLGKPNKNKQKTKLQTKWDLQNHWETKNKNKSDQNGRAIPTAGHFGLELCLFWFVVFSQWFLNGSFWVGYGSLGFFGFP